MTSSSEASVNINDASFMSEQQQRKMLILVQEFKSHIKTSNQECVSGQQQIDHIDEELNKLSDKELGPQCCQDDGKGEDIIIQPISQSSSVKVVTPDSDPVIQFVNGPPKIPAPTVILNIENLPVYPSKTQCPDCQQFVTTEVFSTISSLTWLVCFMTTIIGCVAGCCLIPFCMDNCKNITHRCPKCRSTIHTIKKL